jgi:mannose-6-phosphate isomerase
VDPAGGFQELVGQDGRAVAAPRRSRVQARQSFVFAYAGRLGWSGAWKDIAPVGMDWLDHHCRRDDGLYATLSAPDGAVLDANAVTYDQAFVLLAAAELHRQDTSAGWDVRALALLDRIQVLRRHASGGFAEPDGGFLSNPHMHLFEAALAWIQAGGGVRWHALAGEIADLALGSFFDADKNVLREAFGADRAPAAGTAGDSIEPGHQFEWAWLLETWARISGDARAHDVALALFAAGERGVNAQGFALDETDAALRPRRATARLWPQTERLKAALLLGREAEGRAAAHALWQYLETPVSGLWRDRRREDGAFVDEPAPASSLYHIICAVAALKEAA